MSFEPDIVDDCLLADGTESVTLHGTSLVSISDARRGQLVLAETEFRQLGLESSDLAWTLPQVQLGPVEPRRGDTIEDAFGTLWTILSATKSPLTGVWRIISRKQR